MSLWKRCGDSGKIYKHLTLVKNTEAHGFVSAVEDPGHVGESLTPASDLKTMLMVVKAM